MRVGIKVRKAVLGLSVGALLLSGCGGAQRAYNDGKKALKQGNYEEALARFDEALSHNPNRAEYYLEKGMSLLKLSRYAEACENFSWVILENDLELVRENNKRAYYGIGAARFLEGDYEASRRALEKAYEEPLLPELQETIAVTLTETYRMLGENENALALYELWLTTENGCAADFYRRGSLRAAAGNAEGGISDFDEAIRLEPEVFEYYYAKYRVLQEQNATEEQKKLLKSAGKLSGLLPEQVYYLAGELYRLQEKKKAEELFERAAEEGIGEAEYYLGELLREQERMTEAEEHYRAYVAGAGAEDGFACNQLALCLVSRGEYEAALEWITKGLSVCNSQNEAQLLFNRIIVLEGMGRFQEAYAYANSFAGLFPEHTEIEKELLLLRAMVE